jgi:hypothetical protein
LRCCVEGNPLLSFMEGSKEASREERKTHAWLSQVLYILVWRGADSQKVTEACKAFLELWMEISLFATDRSYYHSCQFFEWYQSASTRLQVRIGAPSFVVSSNSQTRSIPISLSIYIPGFQLWYHEQYQSIYIPGFQLHTQYPPNTRRHASCATSCCQQHTQGPKTKIVV